MTALCLLSFFAFGLYRNIWKFASVTSVFSILLATLVGSLLTYGYSLISYTITQPENYSLLHRTLYMMHWLIFMALTVGSRFFYRFVSTLPFKRGTQGTTRRLMIVGAGWAGANVIRDIKSGRYPNSQAVIAVDDNPSITGSKLNGVKVLRDTAAIPKYAAGLCH